MKPRTLHGFFLKGSASGFSLVELLAVMAILGALLALSTIKLRSSDPVGATQQATAILSAAQERARSSGRPVRVLFCIDPAAGDRYLRSVLVLAQESSGWRQAERIETLPPGTLFWEEFSSTTNRMPFSLAGNNLQFAYIEFDSLGETTQGGDQFVFVEGHTAGTPAAPVIRNSDNRSGFVLRRTGAVAAFVSPNQIQKPTL